MDGEGHLVEPESGAEGFVHRFTIEQTMRAGPTEVFAAWTEAFDTWFAMPGAISMKPVVGEPYWFDVVPTANATRTMDASWRSNAPV